MADVAPVAAHPQRLPPTAELQYNAHEALTRVAFVQHGVASEMVNNLSRHRLPSTVSFSNLEAMHKCVKETNKMIAQYDFVGTCGGELVFSSKFNYVTPEPPPSSANRKKRRRDESDDQCDQACRKTV